MFLRNWLAMVSICFLLAFTGAEFVSSASFIHDFDVGEMLGNDQVLTQETNVSNWDILITSLMQQGIPYYFSNS